MFQKYLNNCVTFMKSMMNQLVSLCILNAMCATVQLLQEFLSDAIIF